MLTITNIAKKHDLNYDKVRAVVTHEAKNVLTDEELEKVAQEFDNYSKQIRNLKIRKK